MNRKHNNKKEKAIRILTETAEKLEGKYNRPTSPSREPLVGERSSVMKIYLSNIREPTAGSNINIGQWVIIKYDGRRGDVISVIYKRSGLTGVPDEEEKLQLEEADRETIENIVDGYL